MTLTTCRSLCLTVVTLIVATQHPDAAERPPPPHAESGFLRAVTSLMQESAMAFGESRKPPDGLRRLYVYGGNVYEMTLRQSRPTRSAGTGELESDFQVRNRTTGSTTQFQIAYTTSGRNPAVARRIVYRPRWWLELELLLKEPS